MNSQKPKVEKNFMFTSEFVSEGHPDKLCDIISDAILDAHLEVDPNSRVACEVAAKNKTFFVFGEITSSAKLNIEKIVKNTISEIGHYSDCLDDLKIILELDQQSKEISNSLHFDQSSENLGAGDQGMMFGYATNESEELMPLSLVLARKLSARLTYIRKVEKIVDWLLPDSKTQVTIEYKFCHNKQDIKPARIQAIVISTQHKANVPLAEIREFLRKEVVDKVIDHSLIDEKTEFFMNQTGSFVSGGPIADAGLTGRKVIVDGYGGWGSHGGGAFSGKDASKVDRSGAYFARYVAKSLVAAEMCKRVLIQVSYCIGYEHPISIFVNSFGTGKIDDREIEKFVKENFDFRPGKMIEELGLKKPLYKKAAQEGHFGWKDERFTWEKPRKLG